MKKLVSRFMAVLMTMTMILSMSMTAFAAEASKGTLTVNNTVAGKTLDLYQIFTATKSGDSVAYTLNSAYEGFFQSKITDASTLKGEALSEKAYAYVKDQVGTDGNNGAAFAKDIMGWILENTATVEATHTTATTTDTTTVISNLDYGYYVVYPLGATDTSTAPGNEAVKSVASLVSVTGNDATVNMKSNYPTVDKKIRYPYLHMDDARSSEITINILSNAVKYTGEGGNISCTLNQYPGEKEGWSVLELIIADNGIGMSEEFQKHIFESFSQERSSSDSGIEGSGLGMGIVKKLVDLMNGKITVQSKPGAGSTFTITLPLKIANAEERNPKHADGQLNIKKLEGKRVLLVEDNDLNAEIATELLTEEGIMIERAENGVACIDMFNKAKQNYYSLILMDIQMPIMNGYEASRRIRELKDGNKSQIPIVAMTANAFEEDKKMALASGMNDHVAKPIDMNVLLPTIMKYM